MPLDANRDVPQTQASFVYEVLKKDILRGTIPGGAPILQAEWAKRVGTSVTPVREAIRRLSQDGLVETAPHKGTRVVPMTIDGLNDIYEMRALIEPLQTRRAEGTLTKERAAAARDLCDKMDVLTDDQTAEFIEYNARFHEIILAHDDSWTSHVTQMLQAAASPYVALSIAEDPRQIVSSNKDHYEMLDAALAGDTDLVVEICLRHLESTHVLARRYLEARELEKTS